MRIQILAIILALFSPAIAVEPPKPLVTLTVKRQLLKSDRDLHGKQGSTREKTFALRVEIVNGSATTIAESELSGDVLVMRAQGEKEQIVKESLGRVKLPAMKPNEKFTLDLGKIQLREVEWRNRKFEETLEEWQVTCTQGTTETGKAVSSDRFETLEKAIPAKALKKDVPVGPGPGRRKLRRLGD